MRFFEHVSSEHLIGWAPTLETPRYSGSKHGGVEYAGQCANLSLFVHTYDSR
jgi:hypothetical protein